MQIKRFESIPYTREPYRRMPLGRVRLDERRLDEVHSSATLGSLIKEIDMHFIKAVSCCVSSSMYAWEDRHLQRHVKR